MEAGTGGAQAADGLNAPAVAQPRRPPQADVFELLRAYREALEIAAELPPSRLTPFRPLTRVVNWLRPSWGLQRFITEHTRHRLKALTRRYNLRLALQDDGNDAEALEAANRFTASLPDAPSKLRALLPLFAILAISQFLVTLFGDVGAKTPREAETFKQLSVITNLNPAHFSDAVGTLLHTSLEVVLDLIAILALSVYIVFRPLVSGFQLKRMILNMPGAIHRGRSASPLGQRAQQLQVCEREKALFRALGDSPPQESGFDLWVKASLPAFVLAVTAFILIAEPVDDGPGLVILAAVALRLGWLARERYRRQRAREPLEISHVEKRTT